MIAVHEFPALGTTAAVATTNPARLADAVGVVHAEVAAVDAACSRFRPDSELMRLEPDIERRVSPLLADAFEAALTAARRTDGAVDPTVGGTLIALGYDRDYGDLAGRRVDPTTRPGAAARVDWRHLRFDQRTRTLTVPRGVVVDLGATGKALACDRAAARAAAATGCGVLVNLGGDVSTAGAPPAAGWAVGIADSHRAGRGRVDQTVSVAGGAVATSSVTTRAWRQDGRRIHHIVDPASGQPAPVIWRTVSVAAPTCLAANTASTACLVRGGYALAALRRWRLPARLVDAEGRVVTVGGWPAGAAAA